MKKGVIYKYEPYHKVNGSVYYAFEYFMHLYSIDNNIKFYIIDLDSTGRELFKRMFIDKYIIDEKVFDSIISISRSKVFGLKLDKTLIIDIRTFNTLKYFLTGEVHCFSNEWHNNFRGTKYYTVVYYGSYKDYQVFDIFNYLKLNFNIYKPIPNHGNKVFISSRCLPEDIDYSKIQTDKEIYKKYDDNISDNLFTEINEVIYYHTKLDTNNRVIVEAGFYNIGITIINKIDIVDSTILRYQHIINGEISLYTLSNVDEMIKGMLC